MLLKTMDWHRLHRCVYAVAACFGIAVAGCTDDSSSSAQGPDGGRQEVAVTPRGEDPEYTERLREAVSERRTLLAEQSRVRAAYEAAKEDDPEGERAKELEKKLSECDAKLNDQRERARKMVAGRIWKELLEEKAASAAASGGKAEAEGK